MVCELADDSAWPVLLHARTLLAGGMDTFRFLRRDGTWSCDTGDGRPDRDAEQVLDVGPSRGEPEPDVAHTLYEPCFAGPPRFAHPTGRPVDAQPFPVEPQREAGVAQFGAAGVHAAGGDADIGEEGRGGGRREGRLRPLAFGR